MVRLRYQVQKMSINLDGKIRKGFTLVELLCVIVIVVSLAGLAMPVIAEAKRSAKATAGLSNIRSTGLGLLLYAGDHDDYFPYATDDWSKTFPYIDEPFADILPNLPLYTTLLLPYVKSTSIFEHPLDLGMSRSENGGMDYERKPTLFASTGSSFEYFVDVPLNHIPSASAANAPILKNGAGFWVCGCAEMPDGWGSPSREPAVANMFKYAVWFGDGHAKNLSYTALFGSDRAK